MRTTLLLLSLLASCSSPSSAGGDAGPCAPCGTPESPSALCGEFCTIGFIQGWRGGPVQVDGPDGGLETLPYCCDGSGNHYCSCIMQGIQGQGCNPDYPASCAAPLTCSTSTPTPTCE